jgi:predicted short-subunit dehydrogenase-like oxidoreductase (DUF2520 family)
MKAVIIGSGNVATAMGDRLLSAGHAIVQIAARRAEAAAPLAQKWGSAYTTEWERVDREADIYIVALSDRVLPELSKHLSLSGRLVVHTAGAAPAAVLRGVSERCGVLYPLQSLRKEMRPVPELPLLIDACRSEDLPVIEGVARSLSRLVAHADDAERLRYHVAAVVVNNFTNHLYTLAADFCRKEGIDFGLLLPIIRETAARLESHPPKETQTGPAIRGDRATVEKHLDLLANYHDLKELYQLFTIQIEAFYGVGHP